jgi:dCMP deaminase
MKTLQYENLTAKQICMFENAFSFAKLSKCVSKQVGSVIVRDFRILSTGYNGVPKGYKNCCEVFPNYNKETDRQIHNLFSEKYEIHAEMNAMVWAAKNGISIDNSDIYCTLQPCFNCTKNIIQSGIKNIYFMNRYDLMKDEKDLIDFIKENNMGYYWVKL